MSTVVYVPRDSGAVSVGAEDVAAAIAHEAKRRALDLRIVRNGSRGLYWLEPMVEVVTPAGRIAYGPVAASDVPELIDSGIFTGAAHRLRLGAPEEIPSLKNQNRLTFARVGITDPVSIEEYIAHGGYRGLRRALDLGP